MKKLLILLIVLAGQICVYAAGTLEEIKPQDAILIVSPHPDDATLAAGGVIQKALKKKAKVRVVYITSGRHNLMSLILYKKFILKMRKGAFNLGVLRKKESTYAMKTLGLKKSNLIFLDYPDSGILEIFKKHWGKSGPFKDSLTRAISLGNKEGISRNSLYKGENILRDLKNVILKVKPNKIFVPAPCDKNRDHIGSYLFTRLALLDLTGKIPESRLYLYIVHHGGLSILERYKPQSYFNSKKRCGAEEWKVLKLSQDEINTKKQAILKFKSQMYCKKFLLSFAKDELFREREDLELSAKKQAILSLYNRKNSPSAKITVNLKDGSIYFNTVFSKRIRVKHIRGIIYLFGYKKKESFANMPKLFLSFRGSRWNLYADGRKVKKIKGLSFKIDRYSWEARVPLSELSNPKSLFMQIDIFSGINNNISTPWQLCSTG